MRGEIKSMTFEQLKNIKSMTDWERVKHEEPDMTDPDAPDFSDNMAIEIEKTNSVKKPVELAN